MGGQNSTYTIQNYHIQEIHVLNTAQTQLEVLFITHKIII